jgi:hypothetical protein
MGGTIPSFPNTPSWRGAQLKRSIDTNFLITTVTLFIGYV